MSTCVLRPGEIDHRSVLLTSSALAEALVRKGQFTPDHFLQCIDASNLPPPVDELFRGCHQGVTATVVDPRRVDQDTLWSFSTSLLPVGQMGYLVGLTLRLSPDDSDVMMERIDRQRMDFAQDSRRQSDPEEWSRMATCLGILSAFLSSVIGYMRPYHER